MRSRVRTDTTREYGGFQMYHWALLAGVDELDPFRLAIRNAERDDGGPGLDAERGQPAHERLVRPIARQLLMRMRPAIVIGVAIGVLTSAVIARAPLAHDAAMAGHFLFLVSIPWSVIPLVLGWLVAAFSADGTLSAVLGSAMFYSMPLFAGAGWGWAVATLWNRLHPPWLARGQ